MFVQELTRTKSVLVKTQHLEKRLKSTLARCNNINLKVSTNNITKSECVRYAGRNITRNGVETAKEDNQAIREFPQPTTRMELGGFLNLAETL